jgi:hypothetical protein
LKLGRIHSEAELAFTFGDDEPPYLGVYIFIIFNFGEIGVVVRHGIQGIHGISACVLAEEN